MSDGGLEKRVIDFWFGTEGSETLGRARKEWFTKNPAFDDAIRQAFGGAVETAIAGGLGAMAETAPGALALVIVLDQFPRNLYRGSPMAFSGDERALGLAKDAVARGFDQAVPTFQRSFFYLPFEHSEALAEQERCIALFTALGDAELLKWAQAHYDIIARFGRFPHRNAALGRIGTPEEIAFLEQPGSSF